jgi:hypothetical protein
LAANNKIMRYNSFGDNLSDYKYSVN